MDLARIIRRAALQYPKQTAVSDGTTARTFRQLIGRAARLVNALDALGLKPGDRVAVLLRNRIEYAEIDAALACGGFIRVALNARLGLEEFSYCVADADARVLITEHHFDEVTEELVRRHRLIWIRLGRGARSPAAHEYEVLLAAGQEKLPVRPDLTDRPAWFSYTSGTTGRPKGVVVSHRAMAHVIINLALELGPLTDRTSMLLPQPLSHGAGYLQLAVLASGSTSFVMESFDPERAVRLGEEYRIDTLKLVPAMLGSLVELGRPVPFDSVVYGASSINPRLLEQALERMGPKLIQIYGQTEAPATITVLRKHEHGGDGPERFSAGRPWRTVEVAVVDPDGNEMPVGEPGELIVRAPQVMDGYHNLREATAEVLRDGWLWTKDMARLDERGFVYLLGRRDQMINSGGFNVAPAEVEQVLAQHPTIKECVVFALADEKWGEAVAAAVVPSEAGSCNSEEIIEYCRPRLGFRRPRHVFVLDQLPYSPYGKVDRLRLMKTVAALRDHPASAKR